MPRQQPTQHQITEKVGTLDGRKVLVIRRGREVVAVQNADVVANRINNLNRILGEVDEAIEKPDADLLTVAQAAADEQIARAQERRDAMTLETVVAPSRARLAEKRANVAAARTLLEAQAAELG
jgi:hypothetical protein